MTNIQDMRNYLEDLKVGPRCSCDTSRTWSYEAIAERLPRMLDELEVLREALDKLMIEDA